MVTQKSTLQLFWTVSRQLINNKRKEQKKPIDMWFTTTHHGFFKFKLLAPVNLNVSLQILGLTNLGSRWSLDLPGIGPESIQLLSRPDFVPSFFTSWPGQARKLPDMGFYLDFPCVDMNWKKNVTVPKFKFLTYLIHLIFNINSFNYLSNI